jgi:hypothetical protein
MLLTKIISKNFLKDVTTIAHDMSENNMWVVEDETVDAEGDSESALESSFEDDTI